MHCINKYFQKENEPSHRLCKVNCRQGGFKLCTKRRTRIQSLKDQLVQTPQHNRGPSHHQKCIAKERKGIVRISGSIDKDQTRTCKSFPWANDMVIRN